MRQGGHHCDGPWCRGGTDGRVLWCQREPEHGAGWEGTERGGGVGRLPVAGEAPAGSIGHQPGCARYGNGRGQCLHGATTTVFVGETNQQGFEFSRSPVELTALDDGHVEQVEIQIGLDAVKVNHAC